MTVLSKEADLAVTGGQLRRLPAEISANPFAGSLLSYAADGYVHELVAGEPFAGVCRSTVPAANAASADGASYIEGIGGEFVIEAVISAIGQDDAAHRRAVYASDDATLTFTAAGNTFIGNVIGVDGTKAIIQARTAERVPASRAGVRTLAATGDVTLTTADLDKLILLPSTGAQAINLPAAADCAGRGFTFKKTTADGVAATLTKAGSDTIDGGSTFASVDAQYDTVTIVSDGGTAWHIVAKSIA